MIEKIIYYSGLIKFFYTNRNLVNGYIQEKKYTIIQLGLDINEISYIKTNYESFIEILENILFTYNQSFKTNFNNISFGNVKKGNEIYSNCIILFSNDRHEYGYIQNNKIFKIKENRKTTIYDRIEELIKDKKLSVRKLIKIGLSQSEARKIYKFLKEKGIIVISDYNNNHKTYNLEKFQKILKK